jgi:hypothetical protein
VSAPALHSGVQSWPRMPGKQCVHCGHCQHAIAGHDDRLHRCSIASSAHSTPAARIIIAPVHVLDDAAMAISLCVCVCVCVCNHVCLSYSSLLRIGKSFRRRRLCVHSHHVGLLYLTRHTYRAYTSHSALTAGPGGWVQDMHDALKAGPLVEAYNAKVDVKAKTTSTKKLKRGCPNSKIAKKEVSDDDALDNVPLVNLHCAVIITLYM